MENILQKSMVHKDIVLDCPSFFLFCVGHIFDFNNLNFENFLPLFLEIRLANKNSVHYSSIWWKHGRVSSLSHFVVYLSQVPIKFCLFKIRKIFGDERDKNVADFVELCVKIRTVKFKRTIHDSTIVESSNS